VKVRPELRASGKSRAAGLRRRERRRSSSASDDEVGGFHARLREQLTKSSSSQSQLASMSTSISLTLPRAATTGLSTVFAPGARVRSVQLPSAAKKRK
jgi:hypothetical protein